LCGNYDLARTAMEQYSIVMITNSFDTLTGCQAHASTIYTFANMITETVEGSFYDGSQNISSNNSQEIISTSVYYYKPNQANNGLIHSYDKTEDGKGQHMHKPFNITYYSSSEGYTQYGFSKPWNQFTSFPQDSEFVKNSNTLKIKSFNYIGDYITLDSSINLNGNKSRYKINELGKIRREIYSNSFGIDVVIQSEYLDTYVDSNIHWLINEVELNKASDNTSNIIFYRK
jgi:hypothetical protein